jgi:hypothetical protein
VIQGSRVRGNARDTMHKIFNREKMNFEVKPISDIDIGLRVDEKTFFDLAEVALSRARPNTRLRRSMMKRIENGQLSSFDLGTDFTELRKSVVDSTIKFDVQFSVLKEGGKMDTGPFISLGKVGKK